MEHYARVTAMIPLSRFFVRAEIADFRAMNAQATMSPRPYLTPVSRPAVPLLSE